jgi:hypothetical protein
VAKLPGLANPPATLLVENVAGFEGSEMRRQVSHYDMEHGFYCMT